MKKKIAVCCMAVGLVLVLLAVALLGYNVYENRRAKDNTDRVMQDLHRQIIQEDETDPFDTEMRVVKINGYDYIGYLSLPTLNLNLPVLSGCDTARLTVAPCRYYGSTKTDNLVIAAHNYRSHFGYLGHLTVDAPVTFTDMEGTTSVYRVTEIGTLSPTAVDQVKYTKDDLILYTCTYSGTKRIVVRCQYAQ